MSIYTKIGAASIALATTFGLVGCGGMQRNQTTVGGGALGAVAGAALGGYPGAIVGAIVGGVAGNALGSDCTVRTYGTETRATYGSQVGQYSGVQTRTMRCTSGANISPNEAPPPGTVNNGASFRTPNGIVIR